MKKTFPQVHVLMLGSSMTGKTTLAKKLNENYIAAGKPRAIVLAAVPDEGFKTDLLTRDVNEFLLWLKLYPGSNAFYDDAEGKYDSGMTDAARIGRHFGNRIHFITHRGALLNPTIRGACTELFLFSSTKDDSKKIAHDWLNDGLEKAYLLRPGQYFHLRKFGKVEFGNAFSG